MKREILLVLLAGAFVAHATSTQSQKAEKCSTDNCKLPDCRCMTKEIPGDLSAKDTPQFIFITFEEAVRGMSYEYFEKAIFHRKNPDGCPISTTHFVSQEYTDYSYEGTSPPCPWPRNCSASLFADIPIENIQGGRLSPLLSEETLKAFKKIGLTYDSSWVTRNYFWPYTFDYVEECSSAPCPKESIPGLWEIPMTMLKDDSNNACSMVDSCSDIPDDADGIFNFIKRNFETQYTNGKKGPFGLHMRTVWFGQRENAFEGFNKFLDYVAQYNDVYVVSLSRGLDWVRHPTKLSDLKILWPECQKTYEPTCDDGNLCKLKKDDEVIFVRICSDCPIDWPWLGGNPIGEV